MTENSDPLARDYLARLDSALADLPPEVRREILAGLHEELDGLDAATTAARIGALGAPEFVAAEARAAMPVEAQSGPAAPPPGRALALTAVLVLIIGSIVVPILGPLVGLVWVSLSTAWSRREKLIAWLIPVATAVIIAVATGLAGMSQQDAAAAASTPAMPFFAAPGSHLAVLAAYFVLPVEGIALLVRANRRGWMPATGSRRPDGGDGGRDAGVPGRTMPGQHPRGIRSNDGL